MSSKRKYFVVVALAFVLAVVLGVSPITQAQGATSVFINEIHYDNDGADSGEAIEIAGPVGTDLAGWSIALYNGSASQLSVYGTISLSGVIADQQGGYGTLDFAESGIQNGAPDGLALVDPSDIVIQFLSYEGIMTAASGPAAGMTSTDIGVSEPGSAAVGSSLQLAGSGLAYEDFTWTSVQPNTFGAVNTGQTFTSGGPTATPSPIPPTATPSPITPTPTTSPTSVPSTSDLIITGVVDGPLSGGTPKAVELFVLNAISDLSVYGVGSANNGGGTDGQEFTFPAVSAAAGSYIYVASEAPGFNAFFGFDPDYTSGSMAINGDDAVELFKDGVVVDVFGDISVDGSGKAWDYMDGWAYRVDGTGPDGAVFNIANWTFSGINALDNETSNATAATPFPIGVKPGLSLPLTEGFDDCTLAGWEIISVDTDTAHTWECNETYSNIEANGYGDDAAADEWLITPPLNFNGQDLDTLTFRSYTNYTDIEYPQVSVLYSTDYDGNGDPASATWTEISGITFSAENSGQYADSGMADLSGINGINVYVAFQYTSSGTSGGSASTWRLDEINFFEGNSAVEYKIHEIQGNGAQSPLVDAEVIIEGIVVGDFQAEGQLSGFHVQEEDADVDGDATTSEGIFVYNYSNPVAVGDLVRVTGTAVEFYDLTQVSNVSLVEVLSSGNALPTATAVSLPLTSADALEAYEGMLITFPQALTISEYFNYDRFGEIVLSTDRQFQPTAVYAPGSPEAAALAIANQLSRITLDDGISVQNPDPARHPNGNVFDLTNKFRGGDTVQNVTGVVDYAFGAYKIQPTAGADYVAQNPRTAAPDVGGSVKVASFNVLNYFTTFGERGADDAAEFDRQRTKIIAALADIDADVVGLIEIENNNDVAVADLVAGLNELVGEGTYEYIATGIIGDDEITMAFIYKPSTVSPVGAFAILDDASFTDPNNLGQAKNRPALAQTFMEDATDNAFTVVVNHLKSKGSECGDGDDDAEQGSCNLTRTLAAKALIDWLATDPTASGDADYLIMGDLNAYDKEDPITAILAGADDVAGTDDDYTDLSNFFGGEYAYSYVFSGQFGYLDYALANASLLPQISGVATWHVNSDEPDILDYDMSFKKDAQDALYEPNAYRASDHDPVIIGLDFGLPRNAAGCFVIAAENSPFEGRAMTVETRHHVLNGMVWLLQSDLPRSSCLEIHGSNSRDILVGSRSDDAIFGYEGRDYLFGFMGDDVFTGGEGRDFFHGSRGQDSVLDYERFEFCISVEEGCPSRH